MRHTAVRGRSRLRALVLLPVTAVLLALVGVPAAQAAPFGYLEICKSGDNGMAGRPFQFQIGNQLPRTVLGGDCTDPIRINLNGSQSSTRTITELQSDPATDVTSITTQPSDRLVTANLANRRATVRVVAGDVTSETLVTFTNQPAGGTTGQLKVCKQAAADSPSLVGRAFSFRINSNAAFSIPAGSNGAPNCRLRGPFAVGTTLTVSELEAAGTHVDSIVVDPASRGSNLDPSSRTGTVTIGAGITTITYTNAVNQIAQTGYIEVCKYASDTFTSGAFDFTITPSSGPAINRTITVGQCTDPIQVAAGNATVTEAARAGYELSQILVFPADREVSQNLLNRTVTVNVPVSADSSDETLVSFYNRALTGQLKICKALAANSADLAGMDFTFDVSTALGQYTVTVTAGTAGGPATCRFLPVALPVGTTATVTERQPTNTDQTSLVVSPAGRGTVAGGTATVTIGTGVTAVTATNRALGYLEICKDAADAQTAAQTFQFTVTGSPLTYSVRAGACSQPIQLPVGTATVTELAKANFHLDRVYTNPADRLVSASGSSATVRIVYGGIENETSVHFVNAVNTGRFKICKSSAEPTLQGVSFQFFWRYTVDGTLVTGSDTVLVGACGPEHLNVPVVNSNGTAVRVETYETLLPGTYASNITVAGAATNTSTSFGPANPSPSASWDQLAGQAIVTYTNARTPIQPPTGRETA